ncbi:MAG: hypothetical protein K2O12_05885, partial [Muribaculaceae bacterium]|nr:hypothetical protein [Muribaculaceae bacterium]
VHHPIRPESILFTENIGNLKLIDVGFDQKSRLSHGDTSRDIYDYGRTVLEALDACEGHDFPDLRRVARRCSNPDVTKRYRTAQDIHLALENRRNNRLIIWLAAFLLAMIAILWATTRHLDKDPGNKSALENLINQQDVAIPADNLPQ